MAMESRAKLLAHPIHQQLIVFPLGLFGTAVVFDLIHLAFDWPGLAMAAHYMIAAGIISGLLAAVFGTIDWTAIPSGTRAKSIGSLHGVGNVIVVALFAIAWFLRDTRDDPSTMAVVLEVAAAGLSLATAWLGGELVDRLGVGVTPGAHLDAPSSLSNEPVETRDERPGGLARG